MGEKPEVPLRLNALTRAENKAVLDGKKGNIWVCGLDAEQPWCDETKCEYCSRKCYFVAENADLVEKNAKKICPQCALEKYGEDISDRMKRMLMKVVNDFA